MSSERITRKNETARRKENNFLNEISDNSKNTSYSTPDTNVDPFNMIIMGMTNSGKTYYLLEFLENNYLGYFDYIFLICPTYEWNKTYQNWSYDKDENFIVISCDQDDIESFIRMVVEFAKGTNSLIILDDIASSSFVKKRTSELVKLGFSARHYGLSVIVITQQLTSIAKPFRENVSRLVTFYNPSKKDMDIIFDDYLGHVSKEEKNTIIEILRNKKYAKLEISLRFPYTYKVE